MLLRARVFEVSRSAPLVSIWRRRPCLIWWHRAGIQPAPGHGRRLTKEKMAWASESLWLKWWVVVRAGGDPVSQPSDKARWVEEVTLQLNGGRRGGAALPRGSAVHEIGFGTEQDTPMSRPLAASVKKCQ